MVSGPVATDPGACIYIRPTLPNGWVTTDCTTDYSNITPVTWGSCAPGNIVTHIGPGDDIICAEEDPASTFVTSCTDTGVWRRRHRSALERRLLGASGGGEPGRNRRCAQR